jgi:hypothetical protein
MFRHCFFLYAGNPGSKGMNPLKSPSYFFPSNARAVLAPQKAWGLMTGADSGRFTREDKKKRISRDFLPRQSFRH